MTIAESAPALLATGLRTLEFSRGATRMFLEHTADELFFRRPCPGGNHAAWILGHIATTDDMFLSMLGDRPKALAAWEPTFTMGSVCVDDPQAYPTRAELTRALEERREAVVAWLSGLTEAELLEPIEGGMAQFAANRAMLASTLAWHEGFHLGQLSLIRRAAGLPPLF